MIWKQGRRPSRLSRLQSSGAAGPAERGGVLILSLPSVQGDGSSDCPTPPLPELSRSLRCRGGERSKLSTPSKGPTPHPTAGSAAAVSGRGARERLSLHVLHTVGTWSVCRGHARPAAGPGRGLLPSPQPLVAPLFQFLQVWNVSVCHQCQPDSENLQLREAGWGPPGNTGLSAGAGHPPRPSPLRNSLHC